MICWTPPAAPRQTNLTMKEYFEGLTAWKERQQRGQQVMERHLEETRHSVETLTLQNQELKEWLTTAEEALAAKQKKIDEMKEEMFQKEKELETLSVLRAQVLMRKHLYDAYPLWCAVGNHRTIGKLVFPMCSESFQNMDSIRIHLMDCVN
ncbi:hypothetical protein GOODEAATRI_005505 [Goodea atripinnis]|uniref:Optineurin n=1 Tax=Goodea atripinnis TaxID=208336 RepID=A0ABV0MFK4_9TELE